MKAIDSKILVQKENCQDERMKEKLGGIEVPMGAGEYEIYKVLSVGEKVNSIKEGDTLITYINPGHKFTYEDQNYVVISITDILVVL